MSVQPAYEYAAYPVRVIDGDTIEVRVDLGFRCSVTTPLRLLGVNAPEKSTAPGKVAMQWTSDWLLDHGALQKGLWIVSAHPGVYGDKYGRWLARVHDATQKDCLNEDILTAGHAVKFMV